LGGKSLGASGSGGSSKRLRVVGGVVEEVAALDPNAVSMQTNALMVAELSRGTGGGSAPKDLSKLGAELPDAASWPAIRAAFAESDKSRKQLALEVDRLKEELEAVGGGGSGGGNGSAAASPRVGGKKATFAPIAGAAGGSSPVFAKAKAARAVAAKTAAGNAAAALI
jgi:hypothetical protein